MEEEKEGLGLAWLGLASAGGEALGVWGCHAEPESDSPRWGSQAEAAGEAGAAFSFFPPSRLPSLAPYSLESVGPRRAAPRVQSEGFSLGSELICRGNPQPDPYLSGPAPDHSAILWNFSGTYPQIGVYRIAALKYSLLLVF